jgi:hypothetical protein
MREKSKGLASRFGCLQIYHDEGDCVVGDSVVILCRTPPKFKTSRLRTGAHHTFQGTAKTNVVAKLEVGYTNVRK